ncbi:MAG TPA: DUF4331 family protein [Ktedonobacterales bacterium]|nr:DUF4331 family protein [Ktedonobacterales bacterium]
MADHLDAPGLKSPNMDAKIDITDIYAFQKPGDPSKTILVTNVNPLATTLADSFEHTAVYDVRIDTNGDSVADIAFRYKFSPFQNGAQSCTVHYATGGDAAGVNGGGQVIINNAPCSFGHEAQITTAGDYKFFAGLRSDPFFFDLIGFLHGFAFTGDDFFIDKNVFGIVLEVPNSALGNTPKIGVWFRVLKQINDQLVQVDRMGRPAINTVFNHGDAKNTFNNIEPTQDRELFEASFIATLEAFTHPAAEAKAIAEILLPDILTYDYSSAAGFLNGRKLTDDVIDIELALVSNGQVTTDKVGPHTDYLSEFPYLGNPH